MADQIDHANDAALQHDDLALAAHRAQRRKGESLHFCFTCGERIPEERRVEVPGTTRCVDCQSQLERSRSNG